MKREIKFTEGLTELTNEETSNINGGGFWGYVLGVVVGLGGVYGERTEAMRAADKEAGVSSRITP